MSLAARSARVKGQVPQQGLERDRIHRLREVGVEAGLGRALPVAGLPVAGHRDQQQVGASGGPKAPGHLVTVELG